MQRRAEPSLLVQVRAAIDELLDQRNIATFRGIDELLRASDAGTNQWHACGDRSYEPGFSG